MALNRALSSLRRRSIETRLLLRLRHERERTLELPASEAELWKAVRALPHRQAQVIALAFLEDRSVTDIAHVLGCDENTVRTHLRRGRLALSGRLRGEVVTDDV